MVTLGFIAEGATEKIILEKTDFFAHLQASGINYIPQVVDAMGNGNLLPHNILPLTRALQDKGATHIFILTDLNEEQCITNTRARIAPLDGYSVIVSKKAIESWFLADTTAMRTLLQDPTFIYPNPEDSINPFEEINTLHRNQHDGRGVGNKLRLANRMFKCGFSILNAAKHPHCDSAQYFLGKIAEVATA